MKTTNTNVFDLRNNPAVSTDRPTVNHPQPPPPAVAGRKRGTILGGVCKGIGIIGNLSFVLAIIGPIMEMVFILVTRQPSDEAKKMAPLGVIIEIVFLTVPGLVVNTIGFIVGLVALAQAKNPDDRGYVVRALLLNLPPLIIAGFVLLMYAFVYETIVFDSLF